MFGDTLRYMNFFKLYITLFSLLCSLHVSARYDETLPKGVRLLAVRQVMTNDISQMRNQTGAFESYGVGYELDLKSLSSVESLEEVMSFLKSDNPELYENLTFGSFNFDVEAKANVTGIGMGYGISNRATLYAVIPYYRASVNVKQTQTKGHNYEEVERLQNQSGRDGVKVDLNSLNIDVNNSFIQSAIQDFYGYEPLGLWEAEGLGDIEFGLKYRIKEFDNAGFLVTGGFLFPTGREDNPDIIQDIAFGRGHFGLFAEAGMGFTLGLDHEFDLWARYEHYLDDDKEFRPQRSAGDLTDRKFLFNVSPGAEVQVSQGYNYLLNDWITLGGSVLYERRLRSKFSSSLTRDGQILENISGFESTMATAFVDLTTVRPYLKKKFIAPMKLTLRVDDTLNGKNVPDMTLYSMELRLFF